MNAEQARALFLEHCQPGDRGTLECYGEKAAVAAIKAATDDLFEAGRRLIAVFDQQRMTVAERIIAGVSDASLKTEGNAAIVALRAAVAKASGGAA